VFRVFYVFGSSSQFQSGVLHIKRILRSVCQGATISPIIGGNSGELGATLADYPHASLISLKNDLTPSKQMGVA
jgi:hypothetical protein